MKVFLGVAVAALVALVAASGFVPAEMTNAEIARIEAEVEELAEAWVDVWRANDCELSRGVLHPDRWVVILGGEPNGSIDDWVDYCVRTIANRAGWDGAWTQTKVRVLGPDAAVFVGTYSGTYTYRDGTPSRHYPVATQIIHAERTASGWGITDFQNGNGPFEEVEGG